MTDASSIAIAIIGLALLASVIASAYLGIRYGKRSDEWVESESGRRDSVRDLGTEQAKVAQLETRVAALTAQVVDLTQRLRRAQAKAIAGATDEELRDEINHPSVDFLPDPPGDDDRDKLLPFPGRRASDPEPGAGAAAVPGDPAPDPAA